MLKSFWKKEAVGGSIFSILRHYTARIIKNMCYWQKDRHRDKWNRMENQEINPKSLSNFFDKDEEEIQLVER